MFYPLSPKGDGIKHREIQLSFKIAVAGKGGCGKTSITSLVIRYLKNHGKTPILAVDADANENLGESLGLKVTQTVGAMLDKFQVEKINIPPGMNRETYIQYKLNEIIVESNGVDLITMGRTEGPGCYCYPNNILKQFIENLATGYPYIVMDNEAGMEHLSRKTTEDVDTLLLVSNHTVKGVRALARIKELVSEIKLVVRQQLVIINMVPGHPDPLVTRELELLGLKADAIITQDEELYRYDLEQKPLLTLPDSSAAVRAVDGLMIKILDYVNAAHK